MTCRSAACEIDAVRADYRAFVGVYPPDPKNGVNYWHVRKFEIPWELVDKNISEDDMADSEFVRLSTIQEVEELPEKWNVDSARLDAPWRSDYPL